MSLSGSTLLHYRVLEKIGEGGMGAVYKAQDTHLDRLVAVKVLPHDKMADPERRQRFVQEAKAASSLNHPNIIVVHDIAADRGLDFIVMEYVDGKTLDALIGRKGLKLNEALGYAAQIADGLAKAHAAGIVHRDLKPTNVMVTPEGRVKILDFGLAKLVESGPPDDAGPTATLGRNGKPRTEEGYILGTVAYMSPEQAEGKPVDARSDIFSFGAVLYEMLTGQKAFHRESRVATLAAVLNDDPKPAAQFNETLPPDIEPILTRSLRKDPARRWQSMSDLRIVLQDLKEDSESGKLRRPEAAATRRRRSPLVWSVPPTLLLAAAALFWLLRPKATGPVEYEITPVTFDSGLTGAPAFSPDGKMFVYASNRSGRGLGDIWLQHIGGGAPLALTTDASGDNFPSFSPDGRTVVFNSGRDGGVYEVGVLGGERRRIAERGTRPRYSPDGEWIACVDVPATLDTELVKMLLVPAKGGTPVPFLPDFCVVSVVTGGGLVWSPDGRRILFNGRRIGDPSSLDWWVAPVDGGPPVRTGAHRALAMNEVWQSPSAWSGDTVYYSTGTTVEGVNIYRVRIDRKSFEVRGPPEPVTSGSGMQYPVSVAADGRLLYGNINWLSRIFFVKAAPDEGRITGEPVLVSQDVTAKFNPDISRDGSKLVYHAFGGLKSPVAEIRVKDLANGEERIIPTDPTLIESAPKISPDGSTVCYDGVRQGTRRTFIMAGKDTTAKEVCQGCVITGFFGDPRFALIVEEGRRLAKLDLSTGERTPLLETSTGRISDPALSPDDRWVAFVLSRPDGRPELRIAPLDGAPPAEDRWILAYSEPNSLASPAWSPNGRILYYLAERDGPCALWSQPLEPGSKAPSGDPVKIFDPRPFGISLNIPRGNATLAVAKDKLALWGGQAKGNIFMATPRPRK